MGYSGAGGKLIHEKNQKQKISWHCPFKSTVDIKTCTSTKPQYFSAALAEIFCRGAVLHYWVQIQKKVILDLKRKNQFYKKNMGVYMSNLRERSVNQC